ncbi:UNKNOWN [Stylonychia lemnae]|uniref:Uncharacterized protein n=1 Tax=Stylonychia lemnae TaxID=5949 RepID=A0A078A390_STYLE|nr:UNKNOWN [Stylonychia lemnae]|eukprot:CDW75973.1 UNKNOWN [Stylonychia lemnae]
MLLEFLKEIQQNREQEELKEALAKYPQTTKEIVENLSSAGKTQYNPADLVQQQQIKPALKLDTQSKQISSDQTNCSVHNKDCTEEFYQKNIEEKMKSDKVRDPKQIQKMKDMLLKDFKDDQEEQENEENTKQNDQVITKKRALQLLEQIDQDLLKDLDQLTLEEQKIFGEFIKENQQTFDEEVIPWWEITTQLKPSNIDIIEVNKDYDNEMSSSEQDHAINLNSLNEFRIRGQYQQSSKQDEGLEANNEETQDQDYEDVEIIDLESEEKQYQRLKTKYEVILRRYSQIPQLKYLLKSKEPSLTVKYLLLANILSFVFFYRRYNGDLLSNDADMICNQLLTLLLSIDAQKLVTDVESGFSQVLKTILCPQMGNTMQIVKDYLPILIEDIGRISETKIDLLEGIFRIYDLLNHTENEFKEELERIKDTQKGRRSTLKGLIKLISQGKQKLIFYASYVKSKYTETFKQELQDEIKGFQQAFINAKLIEKKIYEKVQQLNEISNQ